VSGQVAAGTACREHVRLSIRRGIRVDARSGQRLSWGVLWIAFAIVLLLGARTPVRRTGDAHQYYAMAFALADLRPPALTPGEMTAFKTWRDAQPSTSLFPGGGVLDQPNLLVGDRQEFSHFWFYPLLVAPCLRAAEALGLHPGRGFLILNALLLGLALWRTGKGFGPATAMFLLASPVIWWIDKAQVELFEFALLAIAMAEARRGRFLWAAVAAAAAATQNIPILALVAALWAAAALRWLDDGGIGAIRAGRLPALRPGRSTVAPIVVATLLGAMHPVYYLVRLGVITPQRLNGGYEPGWPGTRRFLAPLVDPDLGLIAWAPLLALIAAIGLGMILYGHRSIRRESWLRLTAFCALGSGALFLFSFSQTPNLNSGGTVHLIRYAIWLLPLMLPLLEPPVRWLATRHPALPLALAAVSLVGYGALFAPSTIEVSTSPAPQSRFLAVWFPEVYLWLPRTLTQVPEVFYERQTNLEVAALGDDPGSAATAGCQVILLSRSSPFSPCQLSRGEWDAATAHFETGWRSVWIVRAGRLHLGHGVRGADRAAAWPSPTYNPAAGLPAWASWGTRELTACRVQACQPTVGIDQMRSVRDGVEVRGWVAPPPGEGPPQAAFLLYSNGTATPLRLGPARPEVAGVLGRPELAGAVAVAGVAHTDDIRWREGAVCPTALRVIDAGGARLADVPVAPAQCRLVAPPVPPAGTT